MTIKKINRIQKGANGKKGCGNAKAKGKKKSISQNREFLKMLGEQEEYQV